MSKYDGWVAKRMWRKHCFFIDSFHRLRRNALKWRDDNLEPSRDWFKDTGDGKQDLYKIIKVRLVEVK